MASVRNKFHELGNWHNKISLGAIATKDAIRQRDISKLSSDESKELLEKALKTFDLINDFVEGADKTIDDFKPYVYENLDPDADIPLKKK